MRVRTTACTAVTVAPVAVARVLSLIACIVASMTCCSRRWAPRRCVCVCVCDVIVRCDGRRGDAEKVCVCVYVSGLMCGLNGRVMTTCECVRVA